MKYRSMKSRKFQFSEIKWASLSLSQLSACLRGGVNRWEDDVRRTERCWLVARGNRYPLGEGESVGREAQGGMLVNASRFIVTNAEVLLEVLVVTRSRARRSLAPTSAGFPISS